MNRQTILLISDMRQVYLAEIMTKRGLNVRCLDIRNSGTVKEQIEKLKSFLAEADMLILPIPVTKIPEQKMLNDILNKNLTNDTLVLGGCFSTEQQELLERRDIHYLDFMKDEIVTEENAVATAEGVIAELVNHSPYNIEEAKIIVTGYGCCGRAVAARFKALGASFKNIGMLMNMKNIYFVPFGQDNCKSKPNSMIAKMELLPDTIEAALAGKQIQPILQTPT